MTNFKLNKREKNRIKAAFDSGNLEKIFTVIETIFEEHQKIEEYVFNAVEKVISEQKSKAGRTTKNEAFKQWCINYNERKFPSLRQKAMYLARYYVENYKDIIKQFPNTTLSQQDPFTTIYKWLSSKDK